MSPYLWAALVLVVLTAQAAFVALFMGRDAMWRQLQREWARDARLDQDDDEEDAA